MDLISVIVPVYNNADTIEKCVDSIQGQNYNDFEIILINDGSTDSSETVIKGICERYGNVKMLSQKNSGVSASRNKGIELAGGEYIVFVDADDTVDADYLSELYCYARVNPKILAVCGIRILPDGENEIIRVYGEDVRLGKRHFARLYEKHLLSSPTNKMYSRRIIETNNIAFPTDIENGEDLLFNLSYIRHIDGFYMVNKPLYNYCIRKFNSLHTISESVRFEYIKRMYNALMTALSETDALKDDAQILERLIFEEYVYAMRLYIKRGKDTLPKKIGTVGKTFKSSEYRRVKKYAEKSGLGGVYYPIRLESAVLTVMYFVLRG